MTPEQLKLVFDGTSIVVMFVWGVLVKYWPVLAKVPNALIPWTNVVGYIIAKFAVPDAHADVAGVVGAIPAALGILIGGFTNSVFARQLYEGFGRGLLEGLLKLKKAT